MNKNPPPRAGPSPAPQAPFQAPAVDRSPTAPAHVDTDTAGAEANAIPWHLIHPRSKGGMAHITDGWAP
ncbi:hypothetical protein [Streptomyces sp. BF23-19]|uniref:hypothetical protein n=1 Tax=Streptomyces sp. BF23-19 TaxID=3240283 RepID=UPI0034E38FA0